MYTLRVAQKEDYCSEDAQEVMDQIRAYQEEGIGLDAMQLENAFDLDDVYDEDVEEFFEINDLSNEDKVEEIEGSVQFYNWSTNQFDEVGTPFSYESHVNERYYREEQVNLINSIVDQDPHNFIATVIEGDNTYFYLSAGVRRVNRMGYVVYKADAAIKKDYLV